MNSDRDMFSMHNFKGNDGGGLGNSKKKTRTLTDIPLRLYLGLEIGFLSITPLGPHGFNSKRLTEKQEP
ncbi:hypothetical protein PM082_011413 [Marasmius tenuissimus]|nr:hypothetical protein PM082_011413 [Marasmius tenuissimus]